MFGSKKNTNQTSTSSSKTSSPTNSGAINSVVEGTRLEGKIDANNDFRIDGEVVGSLNCKGKVIIGPTGNFDGEVQCENAVIEGQFSGNIKVRQLLNVKISGKVTGDIDTNKLVVDSGAIFNVNCNMAVTNNVKDIQKKKTLEHRKT